MAERPSWAVGSDTERLVDTEAARLALGALWSPAHAGAIGHQGGFRFTGGDPGKVTASSPTPDTSVHVAAFQHVLNSSRGDGPYLLTLDSDLTVDVLVADPADPANPRHDLVIAQQSDAFYGDGDSLMRIRRITGTPSATPADPEVDGSPDYVPLARIRVPAGATGITDADIDDLRPTPLWVVAIGGISPVRSEFGDGPAPLVPGQYRHRLDTGDLEVADGSAWKPLLRPPDVQEYTAAGTFTWNKPAGARWVHVRVWGAGGAGGGALTTSAGTHSVGSGGGGGAYAERWYVAADLDASVSVTVGAGGVGVAGGNGGDGGDSSFAPGLAADTVAEGGSGGLTSGAANANTFGKVGGAGGQGGAGFTLFRGNAGGMGFGSAGLATSGMGGGSAAGGGGAAAVESLSGGGGSKSGIAGNRPGGGGSGAVNAETGGTTARAGGNGSDGFIIVETYF